LPRLITVAGAPRPEDAALTGRLWACRGKKAKRKAREKQLEEARRLASLQKKRELKAAGIEMRDMKRKTRGINYNNEVAFEKKPTAGFYDVGEERQTTKEMGQEFRPVTLEEMEGKRRKVPHLIQATPPFTGIEAPQNSGEGLISSA